MVLGPAIYNPKARVAHVAKFSREVVAEVLAAIDIQQVVGPVVELKSAGGGRLKGLCPFHSEKTPSFHVSTERQAFHCFGCGKGGDAIGFLMEHDGLNFVEALEKLADMGSVRLPALNPRDDQEEWLRRQLLELGKLAANHFLKMLQDPMKGSLGRHYLKGRGLSENTMLRFGLGYAPESWDLLCNAAREKEIHPKVLESSGLVKRNNSGGFYDFFRNRVMFPIKDVSGNVVAFGGRDLGDNPAKYINSPETMVYRKSRILYGLHEAREAMRKTRQVLLVEGYFDLLRLADAGIPQVVASCGTALTHEQAMLIKRYVHDVVIVYDGDAAGVQAALKATGTLSAVGLQVRALCLPGKQDPDDYVRDHGAASFLQLVEEAPDFVRFYIGNTQDRAQTIEGRTEVARELFSIFAGMDDELRISEYLKRTARELGLSEEACRTEFFRFRQGSRGPDKVPALAEKRTRSPHRDDVQFLALFLREEKLQRTVAELKTSRGLNSASPICRVLSAFLDGAQNAAAFADDPEAAQLFAAAANESLEVLNTDVEAAENLRILGEKRVRSIERQALQVEAARIQDAIRAAEHSDPLKVVQLIAEKTRLIREMEQLGAA